LRGKEGGKAALKIDLSVEAGVEEYLTVNQVARMVQLSVVTIRRYTAKNEIPFHRINKRTVRYKKSEIEEWVEKRGAATVEATDTNQSKEIDGGLFNEAGTGGEA